MTCSQDLIEAYLDEELDPVQHAAAEQHLATCPDCSQVYARLRQQKARIRADAPYYNAPPGLRQLVRVALQNAEEPPTRSRVREWPWRSLAIAASLLLVTSLSWNILQFRSRPVEDDVAKSVVADHIRSLLGTHLVDVASSDQHTVKPWFAGKLDFAPNVKYLEAEGFPLAGGRVDYVADRRVAALIYRRRQHVINLFTWPGGPAPRTETIISRDGYNLLYWTDSSMTYWAVSDVSAGELRHFRDLYK